MKKVRSSLNLDLSLSLLQKGVSREFFRSLLDREKYALHDALIDMSQFRNVGQPYT